MDVVQGLPSQQGIQDNLCELKNIYCFWENFTYVTKVAWLALPQN